MVATFITTYIGTGLYIIERRRKKQKEETDQNKREDIILLNRKMKMHLD